jgi:hypothetical protein
MPHSLVIGIAAAFAMLVIGYVLLWLAPLNVTLPQDDSSSPLLYSLAPAILKPGDRFIFMGLLLALPIVLLGVLVATRKVKPNLDASPIMWGTVILSSLVAIVSGALSYAEELVKYYHSITTLACIGLAVAVVRLPDARAEYWERICFRATLIATFFITLGHRLWTAHIIDYHGQYTSHYEAVAVAPVRIAGGGTCLADVLAQYGCYGEFLSPLLQLFGSSTLAVTGLLACCKLSLHGRFSSLRAACYKHRSYASPRCSVSVSP